MREFVFDITYEAEPGPLEKLFEADSAPSSTAVGGCIGTDEFWRIERFRDSPDALDEIDASGMHGLLEIERISAASCTGSIHVEVLEHEHTHCELYYHIEDVHDCDSVPTLAVEYLGTDVLFELERDGDRETWSVMMESDDGVGLFYDRLQASLRRGLQFSFDRIGQAADRRMTLFANENLPEEQRKALVTAVERGYYETPRQVTLEELAEDLGCPRSTLSYRLRRAESKLAKAFAFTDESGELQSLPRTEDTPTDA